jgi:hypothetical protein
LHAIPEEIAEKYGLRSDGDIIVNLPGNKIRIPGSPIRATPFTQYEIVERDGVLYVNIPDGVDEIVNGPTEESPV